jgi:hypothetical protein
MVSTGMAHFDQGIDSDPFGQQDAGGVKQWLPGASIRRAASGMSPSCAKRRRTRPPQQP